MSEAYQTEGVIVEGGTYLYASQLPKGCAGHRYKVHRFVLDVPAYQRKVLVEALTGKDAGLWFVCSVCNFLTRYRLEEGTDGQAEQV